MKKKLIKICTALFLTLSGITFFFSCKDDEEIFPETRLFRPVLNEDLKAEGNSVIVHVGKLKKALSYTVEISRDTFKTIDLTVESDTNYIVVTGLLWNQLYQVRATAHAENSELDSKISDLGGVTTQKFPSIMGTPGLSDATDDAIRVFWVTGGAPVTSVKIFLKADNSLVKEVMLTEGDVDAKEKIISGLDPSTLYVVYLYSGETIRGWEDYTTKAPAVTGDNIIDLRGIVGRPEVLKDTLPQIPSGSIVILERGQTYNINSTTSLDRSVTILSGLDFNPNLATIYMPNNLTFASGASVDSVVFKDVYLYGANYGANYVFNISNACNVGKVSFESCKMEIFRGVFRTQSANAINIENFSINNCVVDSISNYAVITVDNVANKVNNIFIRNSTIYKAERIVVSRNNSNSVVIENCTINEAPTTNSYLIDYNTSPTNNVTLPIKIENCILGVGKAGSTSVRGVRVSATTNLDVVNTYSTSDYNASANQIPGLTVYSSQSTDLWENPRQGDFHFKDTGFSGKSSAGDPRWRP